MSRVGIARAASAALVTLFIAVACSRGADFSSSVGTTQGGGAPSVWDESSSSGSSSESGSSASSGTGSSGGSIETEATSNGMADDGGTLPPCPPGSEGCSCNAGACGFGLFCVGGTCLPKIACTPDSYEPNEAENQSRYLGGSNDDDGDGHVVKGTIGIGEVDWFHYQGGDSLFGVVDPTRSISSTGTLRICKYVRCDTGLEATEFQGCPAGQASTSPEGRPGCCTTGSSGGVEVKFNCSGTGSDDALVLIGISEPGAQCVSYTIAAHF
jgi:hypothetical protein